MQHYSKPLTRIKCCILFLHKLPAQTNQINLPCRLYIISTEIQSSLRIRQMPSQLPLNLQLNDEATFENFCKGSNVLALSALKTFHEKKEVFIFLLSILIFSNFNRLFSHCVQTPGHGVKPR